MRLAVLLTGRTRTIADTASRIVNDFKKLEVYGVYTDFFCHQTIDDIVIESHEDYAATKHSADRENIPPEYIRARIQPVELADTSAFAPRNTHTSSYHSLVDLYETHYSRWGISRDMMGIGYLSQAYSVSHAANAMVEYVNATGIGYDYVIKWRYDLIPCLNPSPNSTFFKYVKRRDVCFSYVHANLAVNDPWFVARYSTARWAFPMIGDHYLDQMLKRFATPRLDSAKFEETLHDVFVHGINVNAIHPTDKDFSLPCAIYRDGCTPDMTVDEILHYNQHEWVNQGWERLVLNNQGVQRY